MGAQQAEKATLPITESATERGQTAVSPQPRTSRTPVRRMVGNQAVQRLVQAKLSVNQPGDRYEEEADRVAAVVLGNGRSPLPSITPIAPQIRRKTCACGGVTGPDGECDTCRRKRLTLQGKGLAQPVTPAALEQVDEVLAQGGGRPLPPAVRRRFEPGFGQDFSDVHVYTDSEAANSAQSINAQAYTVGKAIVFGAGKYAPGTEVGDQLLAHELTHVVQQEGQPQLIQRNNGSGSTAPTGQSLDTRVAAFKQLVKTTATHRLYGNRRNLVQWSTVVGEALTPQQLNYLSMAQAGNRAFQAYQEIQDERNPRIRELRANQVFGRFRACTGCHYEVQARNWAHEQTQWGSDWLTPNERRSGQVSPDHLPFVQGWSRQVNQRFGEPSGIGNMSDRDVANLMRWIDASSNPVTQPQAQAAPSSLEDRTERPSIYNPSRTTAEGRLNALLPDPVQARVGMERVRPILDQLGDDGYKVLPNSLINRLSGGDTAAVRSEILAKIEERRGDYLKLIDKINAGEVGYEHFGPIIRDLLPLADPDVRAAIIKEMDDKNFWDKVKAVVVGVASIFALILTIFPPTTALGIGALATLEITLGTYAVVSGMESIQTGRTYQLGQGAHNVFTREQQAMADGMVLSGFLSVGLGGLSVYSGVSRGMGLVSQLRTTGTAIEGGAGAATPLLRGPQTIQRGDYMITLHPDGTMVATSLSRPDLLIVVRGRVVTMYQSLGGNAGVRMVAETTMPQTIAGPAALPVSAGPSASGSTALAVSPTSPMVPMPGEPAPFLFGPGPQIPILSPYPQPPLLGPGLQPPLLGPAPIPRLLGGGTPTSLTLQQVRNLRGPARWQAAETYAQELAESPGQQHFPVPSQGDITGTGGRFVDAPVNLPGGGVLAQEVKMYQKWTTVQGAPQQNTVPLSEPIRQQVLKDIWLRDNVPGYDPRWLFLDAGPADDLAALLRDNNILFILYY